jgi:subtilisin family serine protease/subtilisin-like proprotein convertase family protein
MLSKSLAFFAAAFWLCSPSVRAQQADPTATIHFQFREPKQAGYNVQQIPSGPALMKSGVLPQRVKAWPDNGSVNHIEFGSRVVLELKPGQELDAVVQGRPVVVARTLSSHLFILQAADAWTALQQAEQMARDERVAACYPVAHRPKQQHGAYAPMPDDPFFSKQGRAGGEWQANLENRDSDGSPLGVDLNVRAAWPISQGAGVLLAVADNGIELDHPDLVDRTINAPHFDFLRGVAEGMPSGQLSAHGTAVAGLAAASANNKIGIAGVAPKARLASWVIFGQNDFPASEEGFMDMFQYKSNLVSVQNHSWGKVGAEQFRMSSIENMAISNAVLLGRGGKGVVIVRPAGNGRFEGNNANDDQYSADPRVIVAAAVRLDGRVTGYSSPGACILVAAPSGDMARDNPCLADSPGLVTTDRQGAQGYNRAFDESGDYAYGAHDFSGTSAAAPQIAGVAALILGANPELTYRDVQQILIHSSRHYDFTDPSLITNAAGFRVSHHTGFGVPDAGAAVNLARPWPTRPQATNVTYVVNTKTAIPDLGLYLQLGTSEVPDNLRLIAALPGSGPHPDADLPLLTFVDVGQARAPLMADLRGKAALIQRGENYFCEKIAFAAQAGAELAVIYNNRDAEARVLMAGVDLTSIPSVFISQNDGEALTKLLSTQPEAKAQLTFSPATLSFEVTETLLCEFVALRLDTDHTARGDLRVTLVSPQGTRSVLQQVNTDMLPGPRDWTYYSVQHFYESSAGTWTLRVSDEDDNGVGSILSASLTISGVPINDSDRDGLDDDWEMQHFGTLDYGPMDDPDRDGYINAREQIMGTDPNTPNAALDLNLSLWDRRLARLSWPSNTNTIYQVQMGLDPVSPLSVVTNLPGRYGETEWIVPYDAEGRQFFRLQAVPVDE